MWEWSFVAKEVEEGMGIVSGMAEADLCGNFHL